MLIFESIRQRAIYSGREPAPRPAWVMGGASPSVQAAMAGRGGASRANRAWEDNGEFSSNAPPPPPRRASVPEPYVLDDVEGVLPSHAPPGAATIVRALIMIVNQITEGWPSG